MRPARLFSILGESLPKGAGWGAVFFDRASRPVAWAGEAAGLEAERGPATSGFVTSFHVTRVFLGWVAPRGERGARGTLVVTRRYPTGILRPDLIEFLALEGGPTRLRLRVAASERRDRLLALSVETSDPEIAEEEVRRASALRPALLLAVLAVALGFAARTPAAGVVAARFALLLGTPLGASGAFAVGWDPAPLLGLFGTPADAFLTGLAALVFARALTERARERAGGPHAAGVVLAIPLAARARAPRARRRSRRAGSLRHDEPHPSRPAGLSSRRLVCSRSRPPRSRPRLFSRSLARRGEAARAAAALGLGALAAAFASAGSPLHVPFLTLRVRRARVRARRAGPPVTRRPTSCPAPRPRCSFSQRRRSSSRRGSRTGASATRTRRSPGPRSSLEETAPTCGRIPCGAGSAGSPRHPSSRGCRRGSARSATTLPARSGRGAPTRAFPSSVTRSRSGAHSAPRCRRSA